MESLEGKNGLVRDYYKLKIEGAKYIDWMAPEFRRWVRRPTPHNTTNLWVESCRASPYFFGHVLMMSMVGGIIAWLV